MSLKQKKIKFRPRITKDKIEAQHIFQFILLDFSMERGLGGGGENSCCCCHKKDQTVNR